MSTIKHLLDRIMHSGHPGDGNIRPEKLNPPATMDQIHALEKAINAHLPGTYKTLLHLANGFGGFLTWEMLSTTEVIRYYKFLCDHYDPSEDDSATPAPGVQKKWYDKRWLPIARSADGDYICIDYNPATGGKKGQIIEFQHDDGHRRILGDSFISFLEKHAHQMEEFEIQKKGPVPKKPVMESLLPSEADKPVYVRW